MSVQTLMQIQLAIDVLLCLLLLFLLWQMNRQGRKKSGPEPIGTDMEQLKKFIEESRRLSTEFVESLEEGRKNLKSLAFALDEREGRLRELLVRSEQLLKKESGIEKSEVSRGADRYRDVLKMMEEGRSAQEVADRFELSAGEIELIKNLKRREHPEAL